MIVLQNPDRLWFKRNISNWVKGQNGMRKYEYILDYMLSKEQPVTVILPVFQNGRFRSFLARYVRIFKFFIWCFINRLRISSFSICTKYDQLDSSAVLLMFFHDNLAHLPPACQGNAYELALGRLKSRVLVHMSHFVYNCRVGAKRLNLIPHSRLLFENDIRRSQLFRLLFKNFYKQTEVLPFVVDDRFVPQTKELSGFAVATGAIPPAVNDPDFIGVFGHDELQFQRKKIFNSGIDRTLLAIFFNIHSRKESKWILKCYLDIVISYLFECKKTTYYSQSIVDLYNSYEVAVISHEVIPVIGIGIFEAMACGLCILTENGELLEDHGLVMGKHFLTYNGSIKDLQAVLEEIKEDEILVNSIKVNNANLKFFRKQQVIERLEEIIECYEF